MGHWPSRPHSWPSSEVKIPDFGPIVLARFVHFLSFIILALYCQAPKRSSIEIESLKLTFLSEHSRSIRQIQLLQFMQETFVGLPFFNLGTG